MIKTIWQAPDGKEYSYDWGFPVDIDRIVKNRLTEEERREYDKMLNPDSLSDVFDTLNEKQKTAVYTIVGKAIENKEKNMKHVNVTIKNVIFNNPATIVYWGDGTKTVVKCQEGDVFDPEKGIAMAIAKRVYGNTGSYCNKIKKWTDKYEREHVDEMESLYDAIMRGVIDAMKKTGKAED